MRISKIQNTRQGAQNGQWGLKRGLPLGFWVLPSTSYEKSRRRRGKKIMLFIVATKVFASRLPERRRTGTPHARANYGMKDKIKVYFLQ